jgi:hypothetical protein
MAPSPDGLAAPISFDTRRGAGDRLGVTQGIEDADELRTFWQAR